ncbi:MAG: 50S ribosomal protein L11 methyltransferase [Flavobacteriales bacterium]|nr:50S ribosomal protein L11 methyltransferase [Flavobacteriales bacterium]
MAQFIEFSFTIDPLKPFDEILMAELAELSFDSFVETDNGIKAYISLENLDPIAFDKLGVFRNKEVNISHTQKLMPQENWNKKWEENFDPINVDGRCNVRALFHEKLQVEFDIVIQPKMSFGTGHHATTFLMLREILSLKLEGKTVLDLGCGTGVLGILAAQKKASNVKLIDIDSWAVENTKENLVLNEGTIIGQTFVEKGDIANLNKSEKFDVIFANINRNVLLEQMHLYSHHLMDNGLLLLSGVLSEDDALMRAKCDEQGLGLLSAHEHNNWLQYTFKK